MTQPTSAQPDARAAANHLLGNFTDLAAFPDGLPLIVRGQGCEVIDSHGNRRIDGLSGLFCTNLGHDYGDEIGAAVAQQLSTLPFTPVWSQAHPSAALLAERLCAAADPLGMTHAYFTVGGGESVEAAWKIIRQWHAARGEPQRTIAIARNLAYHGTSLGALSFTGLDDCREPFLPLPIDTRFVSNTNAYRHPHGDDEAAFCSALLNEIENTVLNAGADRVAMIIAEPVQNSGGAFVPPAGYWQGLRDICDRYGIVLVADETITGFGRVGAWFASQRLGAQPDIITFAKGATAAHIPFGGVLMTERIAAPFALGATTYMHGLTFSGHPASTAAAHAAFDIYEREHIFEQVREREPFFRAGLEQLRRIPLVGDVRGMGYFWAIELVKDRDTKELFSEHEANWLLRDELSSHMERLGLCCRLDDRGEPVIQLSPPLVADEAMLERIISIVGEAVELASISWSAGSSATIPGAA